MLHLPSQFAISYSDTTLNDTQSSPFDIFGNVFALLLGVAFVVLIFASMWRVFTKAGKPGWASLVPLYNSYVLLKIAGKPGWWLILSFIPIVNFVVAVIVYYQLVKCFGKGLGFLVLMLLVPFVAYPILGFGSAVYHAPEPDELADTPYPTRKDPGATPANPVS
ncbi:MAG TPA: DUF5684 domain-containing protein [Candidatus Saccharimonadales bacterium]|nr:DUF5684 domain-containing protein [Candidatus Saccharimonadales bacterium]